MTVFPNHINYRPRTNIFLRLFLVISSVLRQCLSIFVQISRTKIKQENELLCITSYPKDQMLGTAASAPTPIDITESVTTRGPT